MAISDPLLGHRLANFRIERVIARGGMAQVYQGWDVKLQRPVAIKVIDARYRDRPEFARRFVQEARAVATWRHENIVQIYYADDEDGLYYYVMEYIDGLDLGQLLAQYADEGALMPQGDVLRIARGVAAALDYVHAQGVVHRDVKPGNVILSGDGRVLLADFGLALDLHEGTQGEIFGSPHYMAPEQARSSSDAGLQSDLYSLAVILYEMLTGVVPFDDPAPATLALQHMTLPPPAPRSLNRALNKATDEVLLKALSKAPEDRYENGSALVEALAKALDHPYTPPTIPERPGAQARALSSVTVAERVADHLAEQAATVAARRRAPWLFAGGALIILLLFSAGAIAWARSRPTPTPLPIIRADTPVPTATVMATDETLPTAVAQVAPSRTPAPTPTPANNPSATPTASVTPSATPATPSPTPPPVFPVTNRLLRLFFNSASLYALNMTGQALDMNVLAFEALPIDAGEPVNLSFNGRRWAAIFPRLEPERCNSLAVVGRVALEPAACVAFNAQIPLSPTGTEWFWQPQPTVTHFRVFWLGEEVAHCAIVAGVCNVYLPES